MSRRRALVAFLLLVHLTALCAGLLALYPPEHQDRDLGAAAPSLHHPLGTDSLGRDQFSRLLYGARLSITMALAASALSAILGLLVGMLAGYSAGWLDSLCMRAADLFLAIPWLYLLLAVRGALPLDLPPETTIIVLTAVIGVCGWAVPARLVRGLVLSLKERDYILAARGFGAGPLHILRRHILPDCLSLLGTQFVLLIPQYILAEVTLSFLGLGAGEPVATWGTLLAAARHYHVLATQWWLLLPGLLLMPVVFGYQVSFRSPDR